MPPKENGLIPDFLPRAAFSELVVRLRAAGYSLIGPRLQNGTVMLGLIETVEDLAHGMRDDQEGGAYRLEEGDPDLTFEYVVGMNSARSFLFPAKQRLYQCHGEEQRFVLDAGPDQVPRLAFIGLRPCDLAALRVLDRALGVTNGGSPRCVAEDHYAETRRQAMVVVVNCTRPAKTCFCASMGTGPQATQDYDLCLTELRAGFVILAGSDAGRAILNQLPVREPTSAELELAEIKIRHAREHMGRRLDQDGLKAILDAAIEHPQWDDVAKRCLSCGNCTLVCPTCFCSTVTDSTGPQPLQPLQPNWSCQVHSL